MSQSTETLDEAAYRAAVAAIAPGSDFAHDLNSPYARGAEAAGAAPDLATEVGALAAGKYAGTDMSDRVGGFFLGAITYLEGVYSG